jgi:hypothetical protein
MTLTFTPLVAPSFGFSAMTGVGSDVLAAESSGNDTIIHKFSSGEWTTLSTITGYSVGKMDASGSNVLLFGQTMPEGVQQVKKSTDGGQTWVTAVQPGVSYNVGTTPCYGIISGGGGILYAYNGDSAATALTTIPNFSIQQSLVVGSEIYVLGANPNAGWTAAAYRSTNGGSSWIATDTPPARPQASCVANNTAYYLDDTAYTLYTISEGVFSSTDTVKTDVQSLCGTTSRVYVSGSYFDMEIMDMVIIWGYWLVGSDTPTIPTEVTGVVTVEPVGGVINVTTPITVEATGELTLNIASLSELTGTGEVIHVTAGGKLKLTAGLQITVLAGTEYSLVKV